MNQKDLVYNLKLLVSEDIELALETISDFVAANKTLFNEWINLKGRYNAVKSLSFSNTIPVETIKIELNNIRTALINLIDRLSDSINLSKAWEGRLLNIDGRKRIYDVFQNIIEHEYRTYCERHDMLGTISDFVAYLIDHKIIVNKTIIEYTIKYEYNREFYSVQRKNQEENKGKDFELLRLIANRFKVSKEDVIRILSN